MATSLAEAIHSMCWLCWLAKHGPDRLTTDRLDQYDNEMHILLPRIIGLHAVLSSMDADAYQLFRPFILKLIEVDANIGKAGLKFKPGHPESAQQLANLHLNYPDYDEELSGIISKAFHPYALARKLD